MNCFLINSKNDLIGITGGTPEITGSSINPNLLGFTLWIYSRCY